MKAGRSVQFKNVEDILTAYESRAVPCFAIFQDKQFLFKYIGDDLQEGMIQLETMVNALRQSAAIYTLAVYEDCNGKINNLTPYDGSFNFRFNDNTNEYNNGSAMLRQLNDNVVLLHKRMEQLESGAEEESEPEQSQLDQIAGFLAHPMVQQFAPALLGALGIKQPDPAALAGVPGTRQEATGYEISQELYNAICQMMIVVPDVEKHLITLGNVAEKNPGKFKSIIDYMKFL